MWIKSVVKGATLAAALVVGGLLVQEAMVAVDPPEQSVIEASVPTL